MGQIVQLIGMLPGQVVELLQVGAWAALALGVAWAAGFFRRPVSGMARPAPVTLGQVLAIFGIYLGIQLVLLPALATGIIDLTYGPARADAELDRPVVEGWLNFSGVAVCFLPMVLYSMHACPAVWQGVDVPKHRWFWHVAFGMLVWLVAFPVVSVLAEAMRDLSRLLIPAPPLDQVAVRHLKSVSGDTLLSWLSIVAVVLLVPVLEELLFRGFLQSWLENLFKPFAAIVLTSTLFTLVHFSASQGVANTELMTGLFVLSLFLGYLYWRQRSLWASIGLHSTFNAISVAMIWLGAAD